MTKFESDILAIITANQGIKAKDIAIKMNCERSEINAALYSTLRFNCYQDSSFQWYAKGTQECQSIQAIDTPLSDQKLSSLCKYYLNCLSVEQTNGVSAFLTSKYQLDYAELRSLNLTFEEESVARIIHKAATDRNCIVYLGYPVSVNKIHSVKTNQDYWKIAPVLLYAIDATGGAISTADVPSINIEIIKQYSTRDSETQMFDLIELESELGFNDPNSDAELDEIVARLQMIRQWQWKENLDPSCLSNMHPITTVDQEGIYNKAVVIIAERSPYTVGLESELSQLMKIDETSYRGTALHDWVHNLSNINIVDKVSVDEGILEVLPLNTEQEQAIRSGLVENLTVVTGPPGTGKSQVVTDLLINNAWQGKNVLFSSKNNKAVDVVETRINNIGRKPIMLRIGGNQYAIHLADLISNMLSYTADQADRDEYETYLRMYKEGQNKLLFLQKQKENQISLRNQVDQLEQRACDLRNKWGELICDLNEKDINELRQLFNEFSLSYDFASKALQNWFVKIIWFALRFSRLKVLEQKITMLNPYLIKFGISELPFASNYETGEYIQKRNEIKTDIDELSHLLTYWIALEKLNQTENIEDIDKKLFSQKSSLSDLAAKLWDKWLLTRPLLIDQTARTDMQRYITAMKLVDDEDLKKYPDVQKLFNKLQSSMSKYLPCWAVTSLSAKGRIPFQPGFFDLVVIDEASQCDIASILPLLYRAKRAVIIGDPNQLKHITTISNNQEIKLLTKYNVDLIWSYSKNSLYDRASNLVDSNRVIYLRDHHRSYGDIIEFSNLEFYNGKLRVATKYAGLKCPYNTKPGIRWIDIVGQTVRPSSGSAFNEKEVESVIQEIKRLVIQNKYTGSVGVVTPFRAQADHIREAIEKTHELREYLYSNNDFLVDTVHKFQGDERDVMIFSPVISKDAGAGTIGFLNSTGNLFNVAVTRARAVLVVVGDMNYCASCGVSYMEHFVTYIKRNNETTRGINIDVQTRVPFTEYPEVSNIDQVSEWEKELYFALLREGITTIPQYAVDKYKLDLALFADDKKLDIEVDGEMYHKDWNGELSYRDQLRNHRLFEMGWDVKRFWVYQIRDELQWCVKQVKKWISEVIEIQ